MKGYLAEGNPLKYDVREACYDIARVSKILNGDGFSFDHWRKYGHAQRRKIGLRRRRIEFAALGRNHWFENRPSILTGQRFDFGHGSLWLNLNLLLDIISLLDPKTSEMVMNWYKDHGKPRLTTYDYGWYEPCYRIRQPLDCSYQGKIDVKVKKET